MNVLVQHTYRMFVDEASRVRLFYGLVPLHERSDLSWEEAAQKAPSLPKGWFELSRLSAQDRIEFVRAFWFHKLAEFPEAHVGLLSFFSNLDDLGIFLLQLHRDEPFVCEMVYSVQGRGGFFYGAPPCVRKGALFDEALPADYLAFLDIHDGWSSHADVGTIRSVRLRSVYEAQCLKQEQTVLCGKERIDPKDLIPFYESFTPTAFQCFYLGWCPQTTIGNVHYLAERREISDLHDPTLWVKRRAFPTFLQWLHSYMEQCI